MAWTPADALDPTLRDAYGEVDDLAEWSGWWPLEAAIASAPREPGVYLLREPASQVVRHVGLAGERASSGRPQGLYGRLSEYRAGKAALGGFAEAALDRALADEGWLEHQLARLRADGPRPVRHWAGDAVTRLDLEVTWSVCADRPDAQFLERRVASLLHPHGLWGR